MELKEIKFTPYNSIKKTFLVLKKKLKPNLIGENLKIIEE